jgi:hypothetical protein
VATDKDKRSTEPGKARYKFTGMKNPGERVDRAVLSGSSVDPEEYVDLHGEADLTDEQVDDLRSQGLVLRKVGEAEGDQQGDENPVVQTREQQQRAQAAGAGEGV